MRILEIILYGYFFIKLLSFFLIFLVLFTMNPIERKLTKVTIKLGLTDNILWIAPLIYFTGGLI